MHDFHFFYLVPNKHFELENVPVSSSFGGKCAKADPDLVMNSHCTNDTIYYQWIFTPDNQTRHSIEFQTLC